MAYDYYKATFTIVTAQKARKMGIPVFRHYGYYVLVDPPVMNEGKLPGHERVMSWCKTKAIADTNVAGYRDNLMAKKLQVPVNYDDLDDLSALASVILDGDDARVYCRGIGTTPGKLAKIVARCDSARADAMGTLPTVKPKA